MLSPQRRLPAARNYYVTDPAIFFRRVHTQRTGQTCFMRPPMQPSRFRNRLLQSLDAASVERLALRPVTLELRHEIEFPGSTIDHVYFIEEGVGSMTNFVDKGLDALGIHVNVEETHYSCLEGIGFGFLSWA